MAVRNNHQHVVEHLMAKYSHNVIINETKHNGINSCGLAAYKGHLEMLIYLQGLGGDLNCKSTEGVGLTYLAAKKGHVNILEYLKS